MPRQEGVEEVTRERLVWVVDGDRLYTTLAAFWRFNDDGTLDMPDGRKLKWLPFT